VFILSLCCPSFGVVNAVLVPAPEIFVLVTSTLVVVPKGVQSKLTLCFPFLAVKPFAVRSIPPAGGVGDGVAVGTGVGVGVGGGGVGEAVGVGVGGGVPPL